MSAGVGKVPEVAVFTRSAGERVSGHSYSYRLCQDGLLILDIPRIDKGKRDDAPFKDVISKKLRKRFVG